jgi:hypothetical protein
MGKWMAKWMAVWMVDGGLGWGLGWAIHLEVLVQPGPVQPIADSPSLRSMDSQRKCVAVLDRQQTRNRENGPGYHSARQETDLA